MRQPHISASKEHTTAFEVSSFADGWNLNLIKPLDLQEM